MGAAASMERDTSAYFINGERWPSVTEILSLTGWISYDGIPLHRLERAGDRGRWVHAATVLVDEGDFDWDQVPVDRDGILRPEWLGYVRAYERFRSEVDLEIVAREKPVKNETYRFVGTPDIDSIFRRDPAIIEIKTPDQIKPGWNLQTVGYALGVEGQRRRFILRLRANATYRLDECKETQDRGLFLAAVSTVWGQAAAGLIKIGNGEVKE